MSLILAIDPGINGLGWAIGEDGRLAGAGYAVPMDPSPDLTVRWTQLARALFLDTCGLDNDMTVIHERMVYNMGRGYAASDLLELMGVCGAVIGMASKMWPGASVMGATPQEWKGNMSKEVNHRRTLLELDPEELSRVQESLKKVPKKRHHDVMDAVGICLWGMGRGKK